MTILGTYKGRRRKPNRRGRWMRRGAALSWAALVTLGLAGYIGQAVMAAHFGPL